jgi:hypothetical protein
VLGTNFSDPEKLDVSADELAKMHVLLDTAYVRQVNRDVTRVLHDVVFSSEAKTSEPIVITKLRPILKGPEVAKILAGDKLGTKG